MLETYQPGQRWLSDSDPDLGLGTVLEVAHRRVRLLFPVVGEERLYAIPGAPLSRVQLEAGDRFHDREAREWRVRQVREEAGLLVYECEDPDGRPQRISETEIDPRLQLNRPQEKLLAARLDSDVWFRLRQRTWKQMGEDARLPVYGLAGPRISLIPHQLYVARQVAGRFAPRVLLADEVGLGKTIEAGLILHRMLLRGRLRRVLILVPEHLLHQWLVEMLRRFNLRFSLFNSERFAQSDADNPFLDEQQVLCSIGFLLDSPQVARAALAGEWDLLIVDEAHHLHWSEQESSLEYDLVEALAEQMLGLLLLSATPEQLGREGHFGRLRLLDPQRYSDYAAFLEEERRYEQVAALAGWVLDGKVLSDRDRSLLEKLIGDPRGLTAEQIVDHLVDLHGTGRALFRNTRQQVQGFPRRHLHLSELAWPPRYAAIGDPRAALTPERHSSGWCDFDPRVTWLLELLRRLTPHKLLLICTHALTVLDLQRWLRERHAIHAAVFHEGMEIVERDRAAAFFADEQEGSRILLCSEIGSEGRNFQFVQHLLLFDLPLEPDLLEQRIGRLDRIGQGPEIHLHLPLFDAGPMALLYRWYAQGLNAFERPSAVAVTLYEKFGAQLYELLAMPQQADDFLSLVAAERQRLEQALAAGRDPLLERHSCDSRLAAGLVGEVRQREQAAALSDYLLSYWDAFGVEHEPGPGRSLVLHPGEHMRHERFPGLAEEGATVTFSRADALAHEDRLFLTWEHPMVRGAMEGLVSSDLGSAAFILLDSGPLPAGALQRSGGAGGGPLPATSSPASAARSPGAGLCRGAAARAADGQLPAP